MEENPRVWKWLGWELGAKTLPETPPVLFEDITLPDSKLPAYLLERLQEIVGPENIRTDKFERIFHARGKSYRDLLQMRSGQVEPVPDAVIYPGNALQIAELYDVAKHDDLTFVPYGGGTSVVGGVNAKGRSSASAIVTIDMTRISRLLTVDEDALTAIAEAGIYGPDLEGQLNEKGYTLGHFPQSFEFSTLGGWIASRGSGQQASRYGNAEDWLVSSKLVTPVGHWTTECFPASAAAPDLNKLVVGSEGTLGIITEATVKIQPIPERVEYRGFIFKSFEDGIAALRDMSQADIPVAMLRLSDMEESYFLQALSALSVGARGRISKYFARKRSEYLKYRGFGRKICLMLAGFEGDRHSVKYARRMVGRIARFHGGMGVGPAAGKRWYQNRFQGPYARDPMLNHGLGVDTLETSTRWSNILHLHAHVKEALDEAIRDTLPGEEQHGLVMGHVSHTYTDGASLYYTYIFPRDLNNEIGQWSAIKTAATEAIVEHGGTISHHHGVGVDHAPWLVEEKGPIGLGVLQAVKQKLDPKGVLNPGKVFEL